MAIDTTTGGVVYGDTAASSYYTNILQDMFLPAMADAVIYPNTLLKRLPRSTHQVEGKLIKFPVHYDDATGAVAIGAGGLLPDPDTEKFAQYAYGVKHMYVRLKFDGITKDAAKSNKASWLRVIVYEATQKSKVMARQRQRIYHNDGSGRLCEIATGTGAVVTNGTTYTLRINQGIESASTCTGTAPTRWLKVGMFVAVMTQNTNVIRAVGRVATIPATNQATLQGVVAVSGGNVTAGDWIVTVSQLVATAAAKDTGFQNEMMGLAGILSDADPEDGTLGGFQGIDSDSATNAWLRANIQGNSGVTRPIDMTILDYAWTTSIEIGDTTPTAIFGSFGMVRAVAKAILVDRRFVGTKRFDGGYEAIVYNDCPLISDRDMYNNRLALVDETDFSMNVLADPQWMDADGSVYSRLQEKDEYQATMFLRENISSMMRKKHTLITDLQE